MLKGILFGSLLIALIVILDRLWLKKKLQIKTCELNTNKRQISSIIEDAPIGIFTSTPEGSILAANEQISEIFGYSSPREIIEQVGDIRKDVYAHPEDRQRVIAILERKGRIFNHEIEFRRRDGSPIWGSLSMRKVVNDHGEVSFDGFLLDITEKKKAAQVIEESQSFLEMALEVANAGTWHFSPLSGEAYHGPTWYRVLGYEPNEFESTWEAWWSIVHPDDKPIIEEKRREFEAPFNQEHWELQYRMKNKKGAYQWILSKGQVFSRDDNGVPSLVMGVILDIQKFKNAETRLLFEAVAKEKAKERLEHKAYHDPLTFLGNRLQCMRDIRERRDSKNGGSNLGVLYFDIVNFGQVNQAYGHSFGDDLLKAIAKSLPDIVGSDAKTHRVGGRPVYHFEENPRSGCLRAVCRTCPQTFADHLFHQRREN